ncbi:MULTISPECIES: tetratricopeptide repeat protein [Cyanophyceae]|uniref:tetratricopeptide repeat protein n=1 Tax=Cyanophyceae TaxID=3028117 RepID=UPI0016870061|nr:MULTISPECIES: tetratricopeptide repeat protein [Cyanophyceae]MBD1915646.1 tetratricopeptide repeat protein [Phormidium sp. FACHB-77]MBD2031956.1 tetratricopeptide repeat protein [Phormidium sp. FACHB-322]MBD2050706.1 tetratricopeptide repeat protein [Leptolyngbya sp. FACHB-60]
MVVKRLIDGRFQFIRVVSIKAYTKTYLMTDHSDPAKAKCIVKHLQLPAHNTITLKFLNDLLAKRVNLLRRMGDHAAIAKNLSTVQEGQDFYWVRDYVVGHSLMTELAEGKPRLEAEVLRFLVESLGILDLIQRHGVTHQNLHPNNLIRHRDRGHLVLVDFGLIQNAGAPEPSLGDNDSSTVLTAESAYLPQVKHRQYTRFAADHFALGMIAVQMATGLSNEAIPRLNQDDFLAQIKLQLDECSTLGNPLKDILTKMVSSQPEAQYHQAKDILLALAERVGPAEPAALAEPTSPLPSENLAMDPERLSSIPPPFPRPTRRDRRAKVWLGAGAAIALLSVAGVFLLRIPQRMTVNGLLQQAEAAKQVGQKNDSLNYLNQAIDLKPDHAKALAQRSALLWENGQSEEALRDLTNAIQNDPDTATWYFQRGNLRFRLGDLQGAIADYGDALERETTYVDAHINRGNARAELGDETGALQDYTAAINLAKDPESKADAYLNRCLSRSNLADHAAALNDCTEAVNLRPSNSLAYENRGLVKRRLNDFQGAIQDFTIAIQINAGSPEPYYNRGLTRQDLGDYAGAMVDFNQTIQLNPSHPFAYYDRGLLYAELGDIESAIADLETVASACLDVSRLGCFDDAKYQLEKLRAIQGDEP